jgi:SNF family Na+-dependent transporter
MADLPPPQTPPESPQTRSKPDLRWRSRPLFLLVSIGAAVGFGNLWRFPYLAYKFGGGTFLIPYLVALVVLGAPTLLLELGLGRTTRRGILSGLRFMQPRKAHMGSVGVIHLLTCAVIASYYVVLLSWTLFYFCVSFQSPLPWSGDVDSMDVGVRGNSVSAAHLNSGDVVGSGVLLDLPFARIAQQSNNTVEAGDNDECKGKANVSTSAAQHFFDRVATRTNPDGEPRGEFSGWLVLCLFACWFLLFVSVLRGPSSLGTVSMVVAPLPFVLLVALFIRVLTLEGAGTGIQAYVSPQFEHLLEFDVWIGAASQIFFSLALAHGAMPAYASYTDLKQDLPVDNLIIAGANSCVSIFGGFVVFGVLGHIATVKEVPLRCVVESGPGLSFVVFPEALELMPAGPAWSACFFGMLFLLGLASAFSLVEALRQAVVDSWGDSIRPTLLAAVVCMVYFFSISVCCRQLLTFLVLVEGRFAWEDS